MEGVPEGLNREITLNSVEEVHGYLNGINVLGRGTWVPKRTTYLGYRGGGTWVPKGTTYLGDLGREAEESLELLRPRVFLGEASDAMGTETGGQAETERCEHSQ